MEVVKLAVSYLLAPAIICLIYVTKGEILPFIETPLPQQWNIQYIPLVLVGVIGTFISYYGIKRKTHKKSYIGSMALNLFMTFSSGFAVIYLWGEKF